MLIYAGSHAARLGDMLNDEGVTLGISNSLERDIVTGEQLILSESITRGFEYPELRLAVITESELYGSEGACHNDAALSTCCRKRHADGFYGAYFAVSRAAVKAWSSVK